MSESYKQLISDTAAGACEEALTEMRREKRMNPDRPLLIPGAGNKKLTNVKNVLLVHH